MKLTFRNLLTIAASVAISILIARKLAKDFQQSVRESRKTELKK